MIRLPPTAALSLAVLLGCARGEPVGKDRPRDSGPTSTVVDTGTPGDTGTTPTTPPVATLGQSGVIDCAAPEERDSLGWWARTELPAQTMAFSYIWGGGMAIGDLDGDGQHDLFIPSEDTWQLWLGRPDRTWEDGTTLLPAAIDLSRASGASLADYDGDGDLDLFVTRDNRPDRLLRNDGGSFTNVTAAAGMVDRGWRSMASAWADWDGDGDLDLSVATYHRAEPNAFWENQGDGTFVEVELLPPEMLDGLTFQLSWHDLTGDGLPELFVANDHPDNGADTTLFANTGGTLVEDLSAGYHPGWNGMGISIQDFDGDGRADIAETSWKDVSLLVNVPMPGSDQGLAFIDSTTAMGLNEDRIPLNQRFSWGIDAGDLDHDGDLDLVATWGHWEAGDFQILEQPDSIWIFDAGRFTEQPPHDTGASRGELLVDLDGDGWLDLVKRVLKDPTIVDHARCGSGSWLTVRAHDHAGSMNRHGIGVTVRVEHQGQSWIRWIESGSRSMFSGGPPEVHFGLGELEQVDRIEVTWPDGRTAEFTEVGTRQHLTIEMLPPEGP